MCIRDRVTGWAFSSSPDGEWIVYIGESSTVRRIPAAGGPSEELNDRISSSPPEVSPDGKWIAVRTWDADAARWGIDIIPFEGGEPRRRLELSNAGFRWDPHADALTCEIFAAGSTNLYRVPLDGGERTQLTFFEGTGVNTCLLYTSDAADE